MNSESQSFVPATRQAESEDLTVDEVRENLSVTEKGQPANTIGNCRTVFCQDPLLRGAIRLNLLTDRVDIAVSYTHLDVYKRQQHRWAILSTKAMFGAF